VGGLISVSSPLRRRASHSDGMITQDTTTKHALALAIVPPLSARAQQEVPRRPSIVAFPLQSGGLFLLLYGRTCCTHRRSSCRPMEKAACSIRYFSLEFTVQLQWSTLNGCRGRHGQIPLATTNYLLIISRANCIRK
jgi:hypothetical protein